MPEERRRSNKCRAVCLAAAAVPGEGWSLLLCWEYGCGCGERVWWCQQSVHVTAATSREQPSARTLLAVPLFSLPRALAPLLVFRPQDLLDTAPPPQQRSGGCDSSDCLICQGQRQFCNQAITESVCAWLGRRRQQCSTAVEPVCSSQQSAPAAAATPQLQHHQAEQEAHQQQQQQQEPRRKRLKPSPAGTPASTPACSAGSPSADLSTTVPAHSLRESLACAIAQQQLQGMHMQQQQGQDQDVQDDSTMQHHHATELDVPPQPGPLSEPDLQPYSSSSTSWQWQPEFAAYEGPAPARFTEVARLQSAADASAGHCLGRCDRVSGLEFSPDGQLLAAAGVSKQVKVDFLRMPPQQ